MGILNKHYYYVESCSREGHERERAWFEKGGCVGAREVEETAMGSCRPTPA